MTHPLFRFFYKCQQSTGIEGDIYWGWGFFFMSALNESNEKKRTSSQIPNIFPEG